MGIEHRLESPLAHAVRRAGSQSAFARLIGRSQTSVYEWLRDEKPLPVELVPAASKGTGLRPEQLRPDLAPLFSKNDAEAGSGSAMLEGLRR